MNVAIMGLRERTAQWLRLSGCATPSVSWGKSGDLGCLSVLNANVRIKNTWEKRESMQKAHLEQGLDTAW